MTPPDERDPVAAQYERWAYPKPWDDLDRFPFDAPDCIYDDLRKKRSLYWPSRPPGEDLRILVAGCGTMAAACFAYRYPSARVVGIDVSSASLDHEHRLKERHRLDNLVLRQLRVEDVPSLGEPFDFIAATGVLHHMEDPVAGLRRLGEVLAPDGVIAVMVYARYGRAGVYMLQDLFRLMGLGQSVADVDAVKAGLDAVGPRHAIRDYLRLANDLAGDEGIVDTFLHVRDRAYAVGEVLDLVDAAGLTFQGWDENVFYHPDLQLPPTHPFRSHLDALEPTKLWQAMELLHGRISGHFFHVCRSDRDTDRYRISLSDERVLDLIPAARADGWPSGPGGLPAEIGRPPFPRISLETAQARFFAAMDGERNVRQCLRHAQLDDGSVIVCEYARTFLSFLWRIGYVMFRLPDADERIDG